MFKILFRNYCSQRSLNISEKFYNKNPRNLELLGYATKEKGWELQFPSKSYYLKCQIIQGKHDSAGIIYHHSGKIVTEASTKEEAIKSKLFSLTDVNAFENLGSILSHRCLQTGILAVFFDWQEYSSHSEKVKAFCNAMENGGVALKEPDLFDIPFQIGVDYDDISEEERLRLTNSKLIDKLKITADWNKKSYYYNNMRCLRQGSKKTKELAYEKVSSGQWWNEYYKVLIHSHDLPHWDENAVCKSKPVTVDDYLPELGIRSKHTKKNK